MTTGLTDDPKHWRSRAHEARIRAGELNDPEAKRQMLGIARGYDRLAERAEERSRPASRALATEPRTVALSGPGSKRGHGTGAARGPRWCEKPAPL